MTSAEERAEKPAPPKEAGEAKEADIRERIMQHAIRLFATKGYAATTIREITEAAEATNPMVYYYFGSKADLYRTLLEESAAGFLQDIAAIIDREETFREALVEIIMLYFDSITENPDLARLFLRGMVGLMNESVMDMEGLHCRFRDLFFELVQWGQERGELRSGADPAAIKVVLVGLITQPVIQYLNAHAEITLDRQMARRLVDVFMRGAAPAEESRREVEHG